jgi:beta-lysine 5,6-aminomutase beta subunit
MTEVEAISASGRGHVTTANQPRTVRPYGDAADDGMVQLSFTLPILQGPLADAAALQFASKSGIDAAMIVHSHTVGPGFTFFVLYGSSRHEVDLESLVVPELEFRLLESGEVNATIRRVLGRRLVVVGACVGTDAHTVGIDAILNLKGFAGQKGLEYYSEIEVRNMGAQVRVADLLAQAKEARADAVLVSQIVSQRDMHVQNVREVAAEFRHVYPTGDGPLLVVGGPRFDASMAADLGVDKIFSRGCTPDDVVSYLVHAVSARQSRRQEGSGASA